MLPSAVIKVTLTKKNDKGFTLLEVLVAIVLIGIMSAIVGPGMLGFLARSKISSAQSNIQGLLQEAQISAIRQNSTCQISLPSSGAKASEATNQVLGVNASCIPSGKRELSNVQVRHNLADLSTTYTPDSLTDFFDFKGNTETSFDKSSDDLVIVISAEDDDIFQKCIVVSNGLGLVRIGNYETNATDTIINKCNASNR